jgi:hypothetical protein
LEQWLKVGEVWYYLDLVICGLEGNYLNPRYLLKLFDKLLNEAGCLTCIFMTCAVSATVK